MPEKAPPAGGGVPKLQKPDPVRPPSRLQIWLNARVKRRLCATHLETSMGPDHADQPRFAVNSFPTDRDYRLTRDQLAVALTAAGFPISSATLATRVSRGEGPPHAVWG
jgi:hypothetical protein